MKIILIILSAFYISLEGYGQNRQLNGLVLNEEMEPISHIFIYINDSLEIGRTDAKGKYEVTLPVEVDSIIFRGVGFEPLLVTLGTGCSRVEVIMVLAGSYDFMSPAKVDRQRRRYFEKINKLYPAAIQKGLFASTPTCHKTVFQPNAPKMREIHK